MKNLNLKPKKYSTFLIFVLAIFASFSVMTYALAASSNDSSKLNYYDPYEPLPQCFDGIDNDGDGWVDYPEEPGCTDYYDDLEFDQNDYLVDYQVKEFSDMYCVDVVISNPYLDSLAWSIHLPFPGSVHSLENAYAEVIEDEIYFTGVPNWNDLLLPDESTSFSYCVDI